MVWANFITKGSALCTGNRACHPGNGLVLDPAKRGYVLVEQQIEPSVSA